jgi:hypothetical protein
MAQGHIKIKFFSINDTGHHRRFETQISWQITTVFKNILGCELVAQGEMFYEKTRVKNLLKLSL